MQPKTIFTLLVVGSLLFITLGDRILPKPFNQYSRELRNSIDQWLLDLFPRQSPRSPGGDREKQLEKLQRSAAPTPALPRATKVSSS